MASADDDRRELFDLLEAGLGGRGAALLMAHLPPVGWGDLATKQDLTSLRSELKGEMGSLRAELKGEMAELRGETAELRGELLARIASSQTTVQATTLGAMIGLSGLVFAVASFAH
jgi:hypothetical protein